MECSDKIVLNGRGLFYQSFGSGRPAVVFESGGECGAEAFADIARQVGAFTNAVIYDRAGLGQSGPAPRPRAVADAVADLHALLHTAQIPGPYLLVAHSYGGMIARLYADRHRQEVAGLIMLDSSHPDQTLRELQLLPAPEPHEPAALAGFRDTVLAEWNDPLSNLEGFDKAASAAQVRAAGHLDQLPLVVVTAGKDEWEPGFPPDIARALEHDWMAMQRELATLSDNSRHMVATESYHSIQDDQPNLVLDLIRELVEGLRAELDWQHSEGTAR